MRDLTAGLFRQEGFRDGNVAREPSTLSTADREVVGTRQTEPELHYEFVPDLQACEDTEK